MDARELEDLVQRLVNDPHDEDALAYAHQSGENDPKSYAMLLERVGTDSRDPAYAAHWLSEAANVWMTTLSDAHRAARLLMTAIDRDPTHRVSSDRLGALYREKGDNKALVALLDRRAKALAPMVGDDRDLRNELAGMHEEMARLWSEPPLSQPRKAIDQFKRAAELDPSSAYAIYSARELLKAAGQHEEAVPLYAAELAIEADPERRLALLRDEAETRKLAGDARGATKTLLTALEASPDDPALRQEFASSVLERVQAGETVPSDERARAVLYLGNLAEEYDGEHGFAYASAALDIDAGDDRAMGAFAKFADGQGKGDELETRYRAYLEANPNGAHAAEAREVAGPSGEATAATEVRRPSVQPPAPKAEAAPKTEKRAPVDVAPSRPQQTVNVQERAPEPKREEPRVKQKEDPLAIFAHEAGEPLVPKRPSNIPPDRLQGILDAAQMLAGKGKKPEALLKYKEVLESDPAHAEAIAWVEDYLRSKRDYQQLKDVLLASVRALGTRESIDSKKERLREVAGLCEGNLRDIDGAISAWRQLIALDRSDESARNALTRLLERSQRWDDLANLLEQEATVEADVETKISLEKKLARLQEEKRKDLVGAAEAWARIARLTPESEVPVATAAKLYERAERLDLAAQMLSDHAPGVEDPIARGNLLERLAQIREQIGELVAAGDSFAEAADALRNGRLWEEAERLFSSSEQWSKAANAASQRGQLTSDAKQEALYLSKASDYLTRAGDNEGALEKLEKATDLDPLNDNYADQLTERFTRADQIDRLVQFLTRRGDRLVDRLKRVYTRRQAAMLASSKLRDREIARELWLKVLEDGDDKEALEKLIDDAVEREDHTEATTLLRRLAQTTVDKAEKSRVALREAELLAEGVGDVDTALSRYEEILDELDPTCRPALQAIADLQENRGEFLAATDALERELKLLADAQERGQIASRLARLYEQLDDPKSAIRALDIVRKADLEDFDALTRLCDLCERTEQWDRVAELLAERIEIEGDEDEAAQMTMKLARILADKLDRGDEALAALTEFADQGNADVRNAYVDLGDRLGWKGVVAQKLVDWWFDARHNAERTQALRSAFDRFAEVGRDQDAVRVAIELVRTKGADKDLARGLEQLAVKTGDQDALTVAHDMLARESTGAERAHELVRQAEVKAKAGVSSDDSIQHGEEGLSGIAPNEAEPLLERLARLAQKPGDVVDLYERQIARSKGAQDRVRALARAAQIAGSRGQPDRARGFYELALAGAPSDETLSHLESTSKEGDQQVGGDRLRRALANAMAAGGHGARDGGKARGALLRRAAQMAHKDLNDVDQAFRWLGDSLVALVDTSTIDELEKLGLEVSDPRRTEAALSHALNEVFDGPLVRQLLSRRAKLRRDQLVDKAGAAADLKKLHDLSPAEHKVTEELARLLLDLADFKGLVQLYEDQILRGKDVAHRAELARKVARLWEEQLHDPRESADAWRRVLRMKAGDAEATSGLERAKKGELKKVAATANTEAYLPPPPAAVSVPPPAPAKAEAKVEIPKAEAKVEAPKAEAKVETPKAEPKVEAPKVEPKVEAPKAEPKPASRAAADDPPTLASASVSFDKKDRTVDLKAEPTVERKGDTLTATEDLSSLIGGSPEAGLAALDALEQTRSEEPKPTAPPPPKSVPPPLTSVKLDTPKSAPPAKPAGISNILDEEIAMSLEKLGGPEMPEANGKHGKSGTHDKGDKEEVIDADDLAELVEIEEDGAP